MYIEYRKFLSFKYYIVHNFKGNCTKLFFSADDFYLYGKDEICAAPDHHDHTVYFAGYLDSVEQCYQACQFISTMFSFGKNSTRSDPDRCNSTGCHCLCETSSKWGKCTYIRDGGYNLYSDRSK